MPDMPDTVQANGERITLSEAHLRYHVPIATLRWWLDKGELGEREYVRGKVVISTATLERKIAQQAQQKASEDSKR